MEKNNHYSFGCLSLIFIALLTAVFLCIPKSLAENEFPLYRVVLDPGHGGLRLYPRSVHGDRYDSLSGAYLDDFRAGAELDELKEHEIVYAIAKKTEAILAHTAPGGDFRKFERIANKYGALRSRAKLITRLSREQGLSDTENLSEDPNAAYRLFDYPDAYGNMQPGRISRINEFKPHIVVSIHLAISTAPEYQAMNPVLAAPFPMLAKGLRYLRGETDDRSFFFASPLKDWFVEDTSRSSFSWFLSDTAQYFTGCPVDQNRAVQRHRFKGYRHNMIRWRYGDAAGWEKEAALHRAYSPYSLDYKNVSPAGKFWDRERSKYEAFRRNNGEEGFGGDNAYASYEIIRYILTSLNENGGYDDSFVPGKAYTSIWIIPMYINAVSAYFELGYLKRKKDRKMLTERQNEIAEGIAVGIYSLLTGMEISGNDFKHLPKGKRIDLEKYNFSSEKSYFDEVWEKP